MRMKMMVLVGVGSAALLATGGTLTAAAAPQGGDTQAQHESAPAPQAVGSKGADAKGVGVKAWDCTRGAICFYTEQNGRGTKYERHADTNQNYYGINSIWNNGYTSERLDHVKIKWNWTGDSTSHWGCFSPDEKWSSSRSVTVDAVRWVDSC